MLVWLTRQRVGRYVWRKLLAVATANKVNHTKVQGSKYVKKVMYIIWLPNRRKNNSNPRHEWLGLQASPAAVVLSSINVGIGSAEVSCSCLWTRPKKSVWARIAKRKIAVQDELWHTVRSEWRHRAGESVPILDQFLSASVRYDSKSRFAMLEFARWQVEMCTNMRQVKLDWAVYPYGRYSVGVEESGEG